MDKCIKKRHYLDFCHYPLAESIRSQEFMRFVAKTKYWLPDTANGGNLSSPVMYGYSKGQTRQNAAASLPLQTIGTEADECLTMCGVSKTIRNSFFWT